MATKTTNYGLTKPEGSDFYDIGVQNDNMDIIDKQMKANANGIEQLNSDMQSLIYAKYAYPILDIANGSQITQTYSYKDLGIDDSCGIFFASLQQTYNDSKIFQGLDYSIKWDSSKVVFKIVNTSGSTFYSIPFTLTVLASKV